MIETCGAAGGASSITSERPSALASCSLGRPHSITPPSPGSRQKCAKVGPATNLPTGSAASSSTSTRRMTALWCEQLRDARGHEVDEPARQLRPLRAARPHEVDRHRLEAPPRQHLDQTAGRDVV